MSEVSLKAQKYYADQNKRITRRRLVGGDLNPKFIEYYQGICNQFCDISDSAKINTDPSTFWEDLASILRVPLHLVFRMERSHQLFPEAIGFLRDLCVVKACDILPSGLAFECTNEHFDMPRVKEVLQILNSSAIISFQESVSMIPPVAMLRSLSKNLQENASGMYLMEMCASPGSKSLQILDAMSAEVGYRGVLVSVENDPVKATQTLPARLKRAQSPCCIVIQGDASRFPSLYCQEQKKTIFYHGILCDAPCSGDGTCRKDNTIQKHWDEEFAMKLHVKQRKIFHRGLELLDKDGIGVYSTCSMNPVENECVFMGALHDIEKSFEVQSVPDILREFCFSRAFPFAGENQQNAAFDKLEQEINRSNSGYNDSHDSFGFQKESKRLCSDKSYAGRVFPHVNNTGGFFTAMVKRTEETPNHSPMEIVENNPPKGFSHWGAYRNFRDLNTEEERFLVKFYGVNPKILMESQGLRLIVHGVNKDKPRRILLVSKECYSILHCLVEKAKKERITHIGVRVFSFWETRLFQGEHHIPFRTTYEGAKHLGKLSNGTRVIHLCFMKHLSLIHMLLQNGFVASSKLAEVFHTQGEKGGVEGVVKDCTSALEPSCYNSRMLRKYVKYCSSNKDEKHVCEDPIEKVVAPGPVWIALNMGCLRSARKPNVTPEFILESGFETSDIFWLSGVLYFTRLELTTKEPIRKGISLVAHQSLSQLI